MNFDAIIKRAVAILTKPNDEWKVIKGETSTVQDLFFKYAMILAAIPAVAGLIGWVLIGRSIMGITIRVPFGRSILWAVFSYIFSLAAVFVLGYVIDAFATTFGAKKDLVSSMKVAVYATTASWLAGIFNLIPNLGFLAFIGGLYSLYLLYLGIKALKEPPEDKAAGYFIAAIVTYIVLWIIASVFVALIAFGSTRFWI